jgi:hypothetical protein
LIVYIVEKRHYKKIFGLNYHDTYLLSTVEVCLIGVVCLVLS